LSPISSASSAVKTPKNLEGDPDDPEPAIVGDIQSEYSSN